MDLKLSDEKLSGNQLRVLLGFKKQKTDKGFSSLKKKELLQLWKEWKPRLDMPPEYDNIMVHSVSGATVDTSTVAAEVVPPDDKNDEDININIEAI